MESPRIPKAVWIFVALHIGLAIGYAFLTPYREGGRLRFQGGAYAADIGAPDERQHVNYIRHLADGKGFPVLNPDPASPGAYENYQAHQPPVFYLAASGIAKVFGVDLESRGGGLTLRVLNAVIGAAGVLGVFFFALWGLRNEAVALAAAAFAALLPMNVALSGAVSNDPMLFALCGWVLALAARGIRDGWNVRLALLTGALMGIAFLTKTTAIALWPAAAIGFFAGAKTISDSAPKKPILLALLLALPLLIAAPWWLRNMQLYGDPLALNVFNAAFAGSPKAADFIRDLGPLGYWTGINDYGLGVGWWTLRSFFGVFGYMDIFWPKAIYWALTVLLGGVFAARISVRKAAWLDEAQAVRLMGGLFFFVVLALFFRFNAQFFQGQARYLFPAMAPIAATVGIGIWRLSERSPRYGLAGMAFVLLGLNVYALTTLSGEFEKRVGMPSALHIIPGPNTPSE